MAEVTLTVERRTEFGKGAARRVRRAAKVPAVLYGHGTDPVHLSLPGHDTMLALKTPNVLLSLRLDGEAPQLALPKHVQRDPVKRTIEHVDLLLVRRGEKVVVDVPIELVGEAGPDTLVSLENPTLSVEAEATHLPGSIAVSIDGVPAGTQVHARDVALPEGVTLSADPDVMVVNITAAATEEQLEAELAGAEAEAGIVHEAPAEDVAADGSAGAEATADASAEGSGERSDGS